MSLKRLLGHGVMRNVYLIPDFTASPYNYPCVFGLQTTISHFVITPDMLLSRVMGAFSLQKWLGLLAGLTTWDYPSALQVQ